MKILFLDIDGVLNTGQHVEAVRNKFQLYTLGHIYDFPDWSHFLETEKIGMFNRIIASTSAQIIIHSSWGRHWAVEDFKRFFKDAGFKYPERIHSVTPRKLSSVKVHEIKFSLGDLKEEGVTVESYLILDDDEVGQDHIFKEYPCKTKYVQPYFYMGLTQDHVSEIVEFFND